MRAWPHTIRFVTMNGVTVGDWDAVSHASGRLVGSGVRSHRASALPEGAADTAADDAGVEPPLQATRSRVSAAVAATREVRITGTA